MATYVETYDAWQSDRLRKQIVVAVLKAAVTIVNEAPETANHAARLVWARAALADPHETALKISAGVITNPDAIAAEVTDATIQYIVEVLINQFASV